MIFDEGLVVPIRRIAGAGGGIAVRRGGKRMVVYYRGLLRAVAAHGQVSLETPYKGLPDDFKRMLLRGSGQGRSSSPSGAPAR